MYATVNVPESFGFTAPTQITFKVGAVEGIAGEAKALGGTRALVVSDKGVIAAGIVDPILNLLRNAGIQPTVFSEFSANPKDFECIAGLRAAQENQSDVLIAIGGGSSMDIAKAIGMLQTNGGGPLDYVGSDLVKNPLPPLIAVPTTSGTGSEATAVSVITDSANHIKKTLFSLFLAPKVAIIDPMLTCSMPPAITAATGMDAFCHAFESYTCTLANPITEGLSLYAMELVGRYLKPAVEDATNIEARTKMQLASTIAGLAITNSDTCGVHCMGEAVGGMTDMPHGLACAICLPYVFEFNMKADPTKHAKVGEVLGLDLSGLSPEEGAKKTQEYIAKWEKELSIPYLKEIPGVNPAEFDRAAQVAMDNASTGSQPRETVHADYKRMFEEAYRA